MRRSSVLGGIKFNFLGSILLLNRLKRYRRRRTYVPATVVGASEQNWLRRTSDEVMPGITKSKRQK